MGAVTMDIECEFIRNEIPVIYSNIVTDAKIVLNQYIEFVNMVRDMGDKLNIDWIEKHLINYKNLVRHITYVVNQYLKEDRDYLCASPLNDLGRLINDVYHDIGFWRSMKGVYNVLHYQYVMRDVYRMLDDMRNDYNYLRQLFYLNDKCVRYNC